MNLCGATSCRIVPTRRYRAERGRGNHEKNAVSCPLSAFAGLLRRVRGRGTAGAAPRRDDRRHAGIHETRAGTLGENRHAVFRFAGGVAQGGRRHRRGAVRGHRQRHKRCLHLYGRKRRGDRLHCGELLVCRPVLRGRQLCRGREHPARSGRGERDRRRFGVAGRGGRDAGRGKVRLSAHGALIFQKGKRRDRREFQRQREHDLLRRLRGQILHRPPGELSHR